MTDAKYYWSLLTGKMGSTVSFGLAASAVYAAKFGVCESEHIMNKEWLLIASTLKKVYGNILTVQQALAEMKSCWFPEQ